MIKLLPQATFNEEGFLRFVKHKPLKIIDVGTNEVIKRVDAPESGWNLQSIREACDLCGCGYGKVQVDVFVGESWIGSNES